MKECKVTHVLSAVLAVILIMTVLSAPLMTCASTQVKGDANGDGKFALNDVMQIFYHANQRITLDEAAVVRCDWDGNGELNISDSLRWFYVANNRIDPPAPDPDPESGPTLTPLDPEQYYGRQTIIASEREDLLAVYEFVDEQVNNMENIVANPLSEQAETAYMQTLTLYSYRVTPSEFERVMRYYHDDHPDLFWLYSGYGYSSYSTYIYSATLYYSFGPSEIQPLKERLDNSLESWLEGITDEMPFAEREKLIHDRLVMRSNYDLTFAATNTRNLLGVMLNGTGVCQSYARAFQYLMYRCGINSALVHGVVDERPHVWNAVQLDGKWYHVDVTHDDPVMKSGNQVLNDPEHVSYVYYNIPTSMAFGVRNGSTRVPMMEYAYEDKTYELIYPVPTCDSTDKYLLLKTGVELTAYDVQAMGAAVAQSVLENGWASFVPTGSYTVAQLKADFDDDNLFWAVIHAANAILPDDKDLINVSYSQFTDDSVGLYALRIRNAT